MQYFCFKYIYTDSVRVGGRRPVSAVVNIYFFRFFGPSENYRFHRPLETNIRIPHDSCIGIGAHCDRDVFFFEFSSVQARSTTCAILYGLFTAGPVNTSACAVRVTRDSITHVHGRNRPCSGCAPPASFDKKSYIFFIFNCIFFRFFPRSIFKSITVGRESRVSA